MFPLHARRPDGRSREPRSRSMRQWALSLPFALRFLLASDPEVFTRVPGIVYRAIRGLHSQESAPRQRNGRNRCRDADPAIRSALNMSIAFHMLFLDGAYLTGTKPPVFRRISVENTGDLSSDPMRPFSAIAARNSRRAAKKPGVNHIRTFRASTSPVARETRSLQIVPRDRFDRRLRALASVRQARVRGGQKHFY
jgi:hypothetical protein